MAENISAGGSAIALSGIAGKRGTTLSNNRYTLNAAQHMLVLPENPKRIYAHFRAFNDNNDIVYLTFGADNGLAGSTMLAPNDVFTISESTIWTGSVYALELGGVWAVSLEVMEISLT